MDESKSGYQKKGEIGMVKCATCGMDVDENKAAAKSEYDGNAYYFCSSNCKVMFDKNPKPFAEKVKSANREHKHIH